VAFFTLLERKIIGYSQYRKGPNKLILIGVRQPIADAAKLLTKEVTKQSINKLIMYISGPCISLTLILWC